MQRPFGCTWQQGHANSGDSWSSGFFIEPSYQKRIKLASLDSRTNTDVGEAAFATTRSKLKPDLCTGDQRTTSVGAEIPSTPAIANTDRKETCTPL
jgi:hypothetical protein